MRVAHMATGKFVAYHWVSAATQGEVGLGLQAQRAAVLIYLKGGRWTLLAGYAEVGSGNNDGRPELSKALAQCMLTGATLVIAKFDPLFRDARFVLDLQESGVKFVCAELPEANSRTIALMAAPDSLGDANTYGVPWQHVCSQLFRTTRLLAATAVLIFALIAIGLAFVGIPYFLPWLQIGYKSRCE